MILTCFLFIFFFFFSSRRRHTRFDCDWSSDVCSSDLFRNRSEACTLVCGRPESRRPPRYGRRGRRRARSRRTKYVRSEEHTSELQSQSNLVCRLLLEKKKKKINNVRGSDLTSHASPCQ